MLAVARRPITADETSADVERDLARIGASLLVATVDQMVAGRATETPQEDGLATYAPRLTKEDGVMDWHAPAERLHDQIRGLHPWPHAFTMLSGRRFILLRSNPAAATSASADTPGTIVEAAGDRLVVAAGSGRLELLQLQAEGKRPMTTREFLAGYRLSPGDRFGPS